MTGGGPVIQILPGPFPFPDSAGPILKSFGAEHEALESQIQNGPYSNNVAPISGTFTFSAWDKGAIRDSVDGIAEFTTQDGARWKVVLDRVQTKDVPHHPKFGGVIRGLYYHGATGVHTPLVPTINSAVALWSIAHLYRNGERVTDNAYVHVMLLSRTRRDKDYALACWDCSKNKIEELQLQITPAPGEPKFDAPGGFLFVNWERSKSEPAAGLSEGRSPGEYAPLDSEKCSRHLERVRESRPLLFAAEVAWLLPGIAVVQHSCSCSPCSRVGTLPDRPLPRSLPVARYRCMRSRCTGWCSTTPWFGYWTCAYRRGIPRPTMFTPPRWSE